MTSPTNKRSDLSDRTKEFGEREHGSDIIRCDACPVLCRIRPGRSGACGRYSNESGRLVRTDPLVLASRVADEGLPMVRFLENEEPWDGQLVAPSSVFVTGVGSGTTYPDYKPAPLIVSTELRGVDTITVVTEGIFSYCGAKVKIDTDRHVGPETAAVRVDGEQVGHVTTAEYGSQMLSIGGVRHLTGGSKREGTRTCETLLRLCNRETVEFEIDGGSKLSIVAGRSPVIDGVEEDRMRVGCGSATIGIFAKHFSEIVDEVVVLDDHITGVLTEHQAGRVLGMAPSGIKIKGRRSTPGRYFQVAEPGSGLGGTNITDPLSVLGPFDPKVAKPGTKLLVTSTTGDDGRYYELDGELRPIECDPPAEITDVVTRIRANCEPARATVLFMGGAGGSLRAGVTENPVRLTRSVRERLTRVTMGGAQSFVWPGGGITVMTDVENMPDKAFGSVPTPAIVAPIEFTMTRSDYEALGGHTDYIVTIDQVLEMQEAEHRKAFAVDEPDMPLGDATSKE